MSGRGRLAVANWKMHGSRAFARELAGGLAARARGGASGAAVVLCPPHPLLAEVAGLVAGSGILVGGQDCAAEEEGARTGDVAPGMLRDAGAAFVIVGHSERRALHGETDGAVRAKAEAARRAGLVAIACVGEDADERGRGGTLARVRAQLAGSLPEGASPADTVVAYEPVWAIGSGRTPTAAEAEEVHGAIHEALAARHGAGPWRVLYGGSVNPANAAGLAGARGVDGVLVGGASLQAEAFWSICRAV